MKDTVGVVAEVEVPGRNMLEVFQESPGIFNVKLDGEEVQPRLDEMGVIRYLAHMLQASYHRLRHSEKKAVQFGEPVPPNHQIKLAGFHWLEVIDSDGHSFGLTVGQWSPGAKRWCPAGYLATGVYLNSKNWRYVSECVMPDENGHCRLPGETHPKDGRFFLAFIHGQKDPFLINAPYGHYPGRWTHPEPEKGKILKDRYRGYAVCKAEEIDSWMPVPKY